MCKAFPQHIFSVLLQYELLRWPFIIIIRHLVFLSLLDPPLSLKHLETEINTVRERCGSAILGWDVCESKEAITRCTRSANHSLYACETWVSSLSFFTWSSRLTYPPWNKYNHFQLISLFCSIFFVYTKEVNALALLTYNYFLSLCSSLKLTKNEEHNTHTCFSRVLTPIHICIQIHTDIQKYTNLVSQGLLSVLGSLVFQENLIQSTAGV